MELAPLGLLLLALVGFGLAIWGLRQRRIRRPRSLPDAPALDALADFGQAILGAQLKLDALCEVVYRQASRVIDTANFQLGLFDQDDYVIVVWLRDGRRLPRQRFHNAAKEGLIGWVRQTGQGLLVGDYEAEWETLPAQPSYRSEHPARSSLFAPLIAGGEAIGVIAVQSDQPNAFTTDDLRLLTVLTNQAAGAIANAQLFERTRQRNRQMQLVSEVSRQITAIQPLPALFRQIVTLVHDTFGYYAVNIFIRDSKEAVLRLGASSHPVFQARLPQLQLDQGLIGWAATHAKTALAPDVTQDDRYIHLAVLSETRAEVAVPLVVERNVLGVLDVQSDEEGAFSHEDVPMLETLASQLALAIQEAETYEAERLQRERLNALAEASRAVVSILNIDDLLEEVVDLVTDYFGYDRTHVFLREGDRIVFRAGSGVHSGLWTIEQLAYDLNDKGLIPETARTGEAIVTGDVYSDPRYVPGPGVEDTLSELVVPIRMGKQVLGVFDIQSLEPDAFSPEDLSLAQALADTIAVALRNATLYAWEKRRRILAEALREVSAVLGASLEMDSVLDGILQGLERVITVDAAVIVLADEAENGYRISAARGSAENSPLIGSLIPADADIAATLTTLFHPDGPVDGPEARDHLFIPLTLGDELIGYLGIDHQGTGRFSLEDIEIINSFATQSAMAIANAQLYMAQREEAWISTALLQVADATARASNLDEVLRTVARITPLLVGVNWCAVLLIERGSFRIVEIEGADPEIVRALVGQNISPDSWPPLADLLRTGELVFLDEQTFTRPGISQEVHISQGVMLPLYAKGEIVGALVIGQHAGQGPFSARKIELIGGIANQAALAIESAQLYAAQQEEAWVTTALLQVAQAVNAQVELYSTLETIVRLTPLLVGVSRCGVLHWNARQGSFYGGVSYGLPPSAEEAFAKLEIAATEHPYFARLSTSTIPILAGEGGTQDLPPPLERIFEAPCILGLPLITQGKLVGVMLVDRPREVDEAADQRRMNILTGIASQTALALETSRLQALVSERQRLERELEVARDIQTSFLPDSAPSVRGWDVAAYYRAARLVGGDFYDFIPLREGVWGLVVADVADKGVPAALYMALSRTLIRAVARSHDDPAATLSRVNELLLADSRSDLFVTIWYGIWQPADGELCYASAGHNPPFVVRDSGSIELLRIKGIALGVMDNIRLGTQKTSLKPGDLLVLYTDGLTEARSSKGEQFGLLSLQNIVLENRRHSANRVTQAIIEAVDQHTGDEPQFDDITLVVVRCQTLAPDGKK